MEREFRLKDHTHSLSAHRWDFDEEKLLAEAVKKHGSKNWELVAKEMDTDRSPRMLYERWNERSSGCSPPRHRMHVW